MSIKDEKEYQDYETRVERLIARGTELGDMKLLCDKEKAEFTMLSEALDEYGRAYHPLSAVKSNSFKNFYHRFICFLTFLLYLCCVKLIKE